MRKTMQIPIWRHRFLSLTSSDICDIITKLIYAAVAELADAPDLGSGVTDVGVQVPSAASFYTDSDLDKNRVCFFFDQKSIMLFSS